jgi:uncharacterized membrane protein
MKSLKLATKVALISLCLLALAPAASADSSGQTYVQGKIVSVPVDSQSAPSGAMTVLLTSGEHKGLVVAASATGLNSYSDITLPQYHVGDSVIIALSQNASGPPIYSVIDQYRLPMAAVLLGVMVLLAILMAGWRGIGSVVGLIVSIAIIGGFIIPQILNGNNPYAITVVGSFMIATCTIFFAHGPNKRTLLALISTCITLIVATGLSTAAVSFTHLNGIASEDISYLHQLQPALNIQGLLFGGIIIAVLGVLDDITVGQSAVVDELRKANAKLQWKQLYVRSMSVGREHIASLINTLVLAYLGTSMVFVFYIAAAQNLPLWLTLNSELVMEEIVRSLVGSIALILAVPIATLIASIFLTSNRSHKPS